MPTNSLIKDQEVAISEQGTITLTTTQVATPGTGNNNTNYTVPTGKKWIIKAINFYGVSLVATVDFHQVKLDDGTNDTRLARQDADSDYFVLLGSHNIILEAGWIIQMTSNLDAYTSGNIKHDIIVQEIDA